MLTESTRRLMLSSDGIRNDKHYEIGIRLTQYFFERTKVFFLVKKTEAYMFGGEESS